MNNDLSDINIDYNGNPLLEDNLPDNPLELFEKWYNDVRKTFNTQPNAMNLSTIGLNGFPQSRIVLLKQYSNKGFQFFTNYNSQKGLAIDKNNKVSLTFFWPELERQVRIEGIAKKTSVKESKAYFKSRPFESRLSATVSDQSKVIPSRDNLEEKVDSIRKISSEKSLKCPEFWGGYSVEPKSIEFWQGRPNRLHDRIRYRKNEKGWHTERLEP
jgi:pyridoxamine 5'-phosphate oxidase